MLRSWKAFGLTLMAALGLLALLPTGGSVANPSPVFAATGVTVNVDTDPEGATGFQFDIAEPAGCSLGADEESFELDDGGSKPVTCSESVAATFIIAVTVPAGSVVDPDDSSCGTWDAGDGEFTLAVGADETPTCTIDFNSSGEATNTPTVTGTPATATPTVTGTVTVGTLTVSAAPSTLSCSGSAFITVVARNAGGQVVAAGTVTLSTNIGTITPTSAVDSGAGVLAVLTAPANQGGTATVTASAGGATGSTQVTINCAQATAVPPTAVPQAPIVPPSTGDAGLADGGQWRTLVGITLLGMAIAGAVGMARSRLRA